MSDILDAAVAAFDTELVHDPVKRAAFVDSLELAGPAFVAEWAQLVARFPHCDARDIFSTLAEMPDVLPALMELTKPEWWIDQCLATLPRTMTPYAFARLLKYDIDLEDMEAIFDAIPPGPHRLAIAEYAIQQPMSFDVDFLRGMNFAPVPVDAEEADYPRVMDCMRYLRDLPCQLCRKNAACSRATCNARPQDVYFKNSPVFTCHPDMHVCSGCSAELNSPLEFTLRDGRPLKAISLANTIFEADGREYSYLKGTAPVLVAWGETRVIWSTSTVLQTLAFTYLEEREVHRRRGRVVDAGGTVHEFTSPPLLHNGKPVGWWAVVQRFACTGASLPEARPGCIAKFLAWGYRKTETGRVRLTQPCV